MLTASIFVLANIGKKDAFLDKPRSSSLAILLNRVANDKIQSRLFEDFFLALAITRSRGGIDPHAKVEGVSANSFPEAVS